MRVGTSLRFVFPNSPQSMEGFQREVVERQEFSDAPLGEVYDTRTQARNLIEIGRAARDAGMDTLLVGDHHAASFANVFQPIPTLMALSHHTGPVGLGMVLLAPFHHPVLIAEQIATMAAFLEHRLIVAFAIGDATLQFDAFEMKKSTRARRTEETVPIVRQLLRGERVTHSGEFFNLNDVGIGPAPPIQPEIWIAATKGKAITRAASLGDAWETAPGTHPDVLKAQLEDYALACESEGKQPNPILRRDIYVAESDEEARAAVAPIFSRGYRGFGDEWETTLVGSPDTVVDRLGLYRELGFERVLVRHIVADHQQILASFELIGEQVIPAVTAL